MPSPTIPSPTTAVGADDAVRVQDHPAVTLVTVHGPVDRRVLGALDRAIAGEEGPVVVDLDDAVIVDPRVLDPRRWRRAAAGFAVVCRRSSGRHLVSRALTPTRVTVARTRDDAILAVARDRV